MAKHTFLTELELTKRLGVVTDVEYDDETVDIPTKGEIREIAKAALSIEMKKIGKIAEIATEKAKAATTDALAAREMVEKFLETARETFRDVIAELLAPHYRYLEEHLGIKPPDFENGNAKSSPKPEKRSISARSAAKHAPDKSQLAKGATEVDEVEIAGKTKRRVSKVAQIKAKSPQSKRVALQKKEVPAKSSAKSKGAKPCRKK